MIRQIIAALWVAMDVSLVLSFGWFVVNELRAQDRSTNSLVAGIALLTYFVGALMSRIWTFLNLRILLDLFDGVEAQYIMWPMAYVGAALGLIGACVAVWVFAPRAVRPWLWAATIVVAFALSFRG